MSRTREDLLGETHEDLVDLAKKLGIEGAANMSKEDLAAHIERTLSEDLEARRKLGQPG